MIRVILDTNSLPRDPASPSAAFKRIVKLVDEGAIEIICPEVIAEEWRTQQKEHLRKQCQKASEALEELLRSGNLDGNPDIQAVRTTATVAARTAEDTESLSQAILDRLLTQLKTKVLPAHESHGKRVLDAYFNGGPPFSGLKSRKDFPDAFLFEAIVDLATSHGDVSVVTADKNLSHHLSTIPNVDCCASLEEFVESEGVAQEAAKIAVEARWQAELPAIIETLEKLDPNAIARSLGNSFVDEVARREVHHASIPSDNNDATISMVDEPVDLEVHWDRAENYGPGALRVPFNCETEILLDFYVFYADAYGMSDEKIKVQWADPDSKPFFDAQAYATARIEGFISLSLTRWPDGLDIDSIVAGVDEISEIDLEEDEYGDALY